MNPTEQQSDWTRGISGSRRLTSKPAISPALAGNEGASEMLRGETGPVATGKRARRRVQLSMHAGNWIWAPWGWGKSSGSWLDEAPRQETAKTGPFDWIETIRGLLFFGLLTTVLWLEWMAIKSLALYVTAFM